LGGLDSGSEGDVDIVTREDMARRYQALDYRKKYTCMREKEVKLLF
jgi:hypothetical protein